MNHENLSTYLNDHYAGSVFAVEFIGHLVNSVPSPDLKMFLGNLLVEITEDQTVLRQIMDRIGIAENRMKTATAWMSEKMERLILHPSHEGDPALLLSLESLALGIFGKKSLWRALAANGGEPAFKGIDFGLLESRAGEQLKAVEARRIETARATLHYVRKT